MRVFAGCLAIIVAVVLVLWLWPARSCDTDMHPAQADGGTVEQADAFDAGAGRTAASDAGATTPRPLPPALDTTGGQGRQPDGGAAHEARWMAWPQNCGFDVRGAYSCGSCRNDSECPPQHACLVNAATGNTECLPEECEDDSACPADAECRPANTGATGAQIWRCIPTGSQGINDPCSPFPHGPEESCQRGLICVFGRCGADCEDDGGCPQGSTCVDDVSGWGCLRSCEETGCPAGEDCVSLGEAVHACARKQGQDCTRTPCPEGQSCARSYELRTRVVVYHCEQPCNPFKTSSCPKGYVCGAGGMGSVCYRKCNPRAPDQRSTGCPKGQACASVNEDMTEFGCVVSVEEEK